VDGALARDRGAFGWANQYGPSWRFRAAGAERPGYGGGNGPSAPALQQALLAPPHAAYGDLGAATAGGVCLNLSTHLCIHRRCRRKWAVSRHQWQAMRKRPVCPKRYLSASWVPTLSL